MVYLSATEAAKRLGVSEKTVRRWIQENRLTAFHPHGYKNRLAIAEQDVEQKARELAEFEQPGHKQGPAKEDVSSLTKELERQRREIVDLKTSVAALEQLYYKLQGQTPGPDGEASPLPLQGRIEPIKRGRPVGSVKAETPKEIPSGSVPYAVFAEQHGVNERTARDQIDKGYIPAFVRARPSNPRFKERWLTPAQQAAAIQFWQSHETRGFTPCFTCPHDQAQEENHVLELP